MTDSLGHTHYTHPFTSNPGNHGNHTGATLFPSTQWHSPHHPNTHGKHDTTPVYQNSITQSHYANNSADTATQAAHKQ